MSGVQIPFPLTHDFLAREQNLTVFSIIFISENVKKCVNSVRFENEETINACVFQLELDFQNFNKRAYIKGLIFEIYSLRIIILILMYKERYNKN